MRLQRLGTIRVFVLLGSKMGGMYMHDLQRLGRLDQAVKPQSRKVAKVGGGRCSTANKQLRLVEPGKQGNGERRQRETG